MCWPGIIIKNAKLHTPKAGSGADTANDPVCWRPSLTRQKMLVSEYLAVAVDSS